jgi:predicted Zn-dependent protease with MMP-like domain
VNLIPIDKFEAHVETALDAIDAGLASLMDNVVIVVEDRNLDEPDLLGLYEGIPLTEREAYGLLEMPDKVSIYRLALCQMCSSRDELVEEIRTTVIHEVAHHFGIDDERLDELGWA